LFALLLAAGVFLWMQPQARAQDLSLPGRSFSLLSAPVTGISPSLQADREQDNSQGSTDDNIFNRFSTGREAFAPDHDVYEVPVLLRPQGDSRAEFTRNTGFGYVAGSFARKRVYFTWALSMAQARWLPTAKDIRAVSVHEATLIPVLNFHMGRHLALGLGLGLGVMDALVDYEDGDYRHRIEPFIPARLGLTIFLGETLVASFTLAASPYWGGTPLVSHSRVLFGLGYNH